MNCVFCGQDPELIVLTWRPDGSEQVMACLECAIERGVYCTQHKKPHTGINGRGGKGTICWDCVDAATLKHVGQADFFVRRLQEFLPKSEFDRIVQWVDDMEEPWSHLDRLAIILRGLLLEAHRRRATPRDVVDGMIERRSADAMLPLAY